MKSGCIKKTFFGCSAVFLFFFIVIILLIISAELPEIDFTSLDTKKREYEIEADSLTKENVITSSFSWQFVDNNFKKRRYDIKLKLLESNVKEAMDYIEKLAAMSYKELGLKRKYSNPITESRAVWTEVYSRIYNYSFPQMKSVFEGLNKIFIEEKFETRDRVYFVITFIQNIMYERPGGVLDLFPPIGTLAYRFGDCDSKALLLYVILERMGVDCAMLWSHNYKHAMLGISVSAKGEYLITNGKKYYILETTYPQWNVGDIPPEFSNTKFWFIAEIDNEVNKRNLINTEDDGSNETESRRDTKPSPSKP